MSSAPAQSTSDDCGAVAAQNARAPARPASVVQPTASTLSGDSDRSRHAPDRVGVSLPGGWVLLSPASALYCDRALALAVKAARRDRISMPAEVRALVMLLANALATSGLPAPEVPNGAESAPSRRSGSIPVVSSADTLGPRFVDVGSAADLLGITDRGVRDLCSRGALPGEKFAGRWLIDEVDLEAYARQRAAREAGTSDDPKTPRAPQAE
jgi:hypothetical protein